MTCQTCKGPLYAVLVITGGCRGHGPDEYCYCNSQDAHIELRCTNLKCKGRTQILKPPGLTDQNGIDRFFTDYFAEVTK